MFHRHHKKNYKYLLLCNYNKHNDKNILFLVIRIKILNADSNIFYYLILSINIPESPNNNLNQFIFKKISGRFYVYKNINNPVHMHLLKKYYLG